MDRKVNKISHRDKEQINNGDFVKSEKVDASDWDVESDDFVFVSKILKKVKKAWYGTNHDSFKPDSPMGLFLKPERKEFKSLAILRL